MFFLDLLRIKGPLRLIEHEHVLRRHTIRLCRVPLHVLLDAAYERFASAPGSLKLVLEHLNQRPIAGQVDRWSRGSTFRTRHRKVVEEMGMDDAEAHQSLACARYTRQEDETTRALLGSFTDDPADLLDRRIRGCSCAMNRSQIASFEEFPRCFNEGRQGAIGLLIEESLWQDGRACRVCGELFDKRIQGVGTDDLDTGFISQTTLRKSRYENRNDGPVSTLPVITG